MLFFGQCSDSNVGPTAILWSWMSNRIRSAAVAVVAAVLIGIASGQTRTPVTSVRITGRVVDVAGEPIYAFVTLRLVSEDASATTWTEKDGSFTLC